MYNTLKAILLVAFVLTLPCVINAKKPQKPKGNLIYVSYSITKSAGLGKDYCELINENGSIDIIEVHNQDSRLAEETRHTYKATAADVQAISKTLKSLKAWRLTSGSEDNVAPGSVRFRVYMEYDSGEQIGSVWYGAGTKEQQTILNAIQGFFSKHTMTANPQ